MLTSGAQVSRLALRQRRPAKRPACFYLLFGDATKNHATRPLGVLEWSPKRSPTRRKFNMKNRVLVALPLAAVLALPAFAQTTLVSQDQPAASQPPASCNSHADHRQRHRQTAFAAADSREGFWGRVNPFARKKYVQRQTEPIRDRVNELDELTAANSKTIKDVDARAQQGIQLASAKANEADQHAIDAGNKATSGAADRNTGQHPPPTVETVVGNIDQYKATNQTEIRFRPGQSVLSKNAKDALDEMATP